MAKKTKHSSEKAARTATRKARRNLAVRSATKTMRSRVASLVEGGDVAGAEAALKRAVSFIDRAASKGVVHPTRAARLKSRLARKLNGAKAAPA